MSARSGPPPFARPELVEPHEPALRRVDQRPVLTRTGAVGREDVARRGVAVGDGDGQDRGLDAGQRVEALIVGRRRLRVGELRGAPPSDRGCRRGSRKAIGLAAAPAPRRSPRRSRLTARARRRRTGCRARSSRRRPASSRPGARREPTPLPDARPRPRRVGGVDRARRRGRHAQEADLRVLLALGSPCRFPAPARQSTLRQPAEMRGSILRKFFAAPACDVRSDR
jgi:hypothetical protein